MNDYPILVFDCNYLGYRAYYTTGSLMAGDIATGVLYGFLSQVLELADLFDTCNLVFCWDSKHSKRKTISKEYKNNRKKDPEEAAKFATVYKQFRLLRKKILPKLGFNNVFIQKGYEADDMIASVTINNCKDMIIISSDEDLFQLLSPMVKMYVASREKMYTEKAFIKEKGITPKEWVYVKAIAGCNSDNVKGIPGVGEKTYTKYLLKKLKRHSVSYQKIEQLGDKFFDKNYRLVELPFKGTKKICLQKNNLSVDAFRKICKKYRFHSFMKGDRIQTWKRMCHEN